MKTTYLKPVLDLAATGAKIKTVMKDKGITARELQIIMDFPYVQTIYNWFAGKNMPTIDNLVVLAKILAVPMDELVLAPGEINHFGPIENRQLQTNKKSHCHNS